MLRIVWTPQAVDILRDQVSFSSRVSGIPLSVLHKNPLGRAISRLLELSDFSGMWLHGLPASTHQLCQCQQGSAVISVFQDHLMRGIV